MYQLATEYVRENETEVRAKIRSMYDSACNERLYVEFNASKDEAVGIGVFQGEGYYASDVEARMIDLLEMDESKRDLSAYFEVDAEEYAKMKAEDDIDYDSFIDDDVAMIYARLWIK